MFDNLPEEKRQKVLSAALDEFAEQGYASASTNRIVEKAEISKGLLFHYFRNKKGLYAYLLRHCMKVLGQEYEDVLPTTSSDVFERIKQLTVMKIHQMKHYPQEYDLLLKLARETDPELMAEYAQLTAELKGHFLGKFFAGLDHTLFRPGVDVQKALEIIMCTTEHYGNKYVAENTDADGRLHLDADKIGLELDEYASLLKNGLYT
ncbi:TetR family transcriptional regulator [Tumebacillus sp. BK434]|uniref:TetR/AcrR family transcriptional regulator n=1 Tax=Tumebacillus sp. BK434 TaxID=2512169 RepID=UPI0010DD905A|nr:TetR/AcrR family transcriptional regulator [Tumebacillus sp. BK434]TCP55752.1 TetR family transcriptional regulator [Tumebacillus sp. BK434]